MTEIDVPVIGGPWVPAKEFFENVQEAIDNSHGHENKSVLDKIDDKFIENASDAVKNNHSHENKVVLDEVTEEMIENNHSHANKEYLDTLSERPTATLYLNSSEGYAEADIPAPECFVIKDYNNQLTDDVIPDGAEIQKIELRLSENDEWVNIHDMHTVDGVPYHISMSKVYRNSEKNKVFAIASYLFQSSNYIYNALANADNVYIRITYYTD